MGSVQDDETRADSLHRIERSVHRGGGEVAMQEQHLDERTRPGAVTETAAGTLPEALVRGGEATA